MRQEDPNQRPTASEALKNFRLATSALSQDVRDLFLPIDRVFWYTKASHLRTTEEKEKVANARAEIEELARQQTGSSE